VSLIALRGVIKQYQLGHATVDALRGIDLDIDRGDLAALWGPSGSGKTSLLNVIGLIDTPNAGTVTIAGRGVASVGDDRLAELRNQLVGFVFQNFNLVPVLTAVENVMLPLQIRGVRSRMAHGAARDKLEQVGLGRNLDARPDQMSGGQRQRVAIARALITNPALLLADEPTANLDSESSSQIVSLLHNLNTEHGVTVLFATHDARVLRSVTRRIRIEDGRISTEEYADALVQDRYV
jgi:putative ABC transport system ATP-binding protein